LKIPARSGQADGSAIAEEDSDVDVPYLGYSAPAASIEFEITMQVIIARVSVVELKLGRELTTRNCRGVRVIVASTETQAPPTLCEHGAELLDAEMTESTGDDELHVIFSVSVGDGSNGSVIVSGVFSHGHETRILSTVSEDPGIVAPLDSVGAETDSTGTAQPPSS
jgi:hypothetical protein